MIERRVFNSGVEDCSLFARTCPKLISYTTVKLWQRSSRRTHATFADIAKFCARLPENPERALTPQELYKVNFYHAENNAGKMKNNDLCYVLCFKFL